MQQKFQDFYQFLVLESQFLLERIWLLYIKVCNADFVMELDYIPRLLLVLLFFKHFFKEEIGLWVELRHSIKFRLPLNSKEFEVASSVLCNSWSLK